MKILLICNKSPYPPLEGGPIAMNMMIEGLIDAGHKVKVLAINTNKYYTDIESIPFDYREKTRIELPYTDLGLNPLTALYCLITGKSFHAYRFNSNSWLKPLGKILSDEQFDIIQIETLFMAPALDVIKKKSKAKVVLRAHNVEYLIWKRVYLSATNPVRRWYLNHLWKTLRNFEKEMLPQFDGIVPITSQDAELIRKNGISIPIKAIPFGLQASKIATTTAPLPDTPIAFHIGSMDWIPNQEGIKWLIEEVWPRVKMRIPDAILRLAGRNMPQWLLKMEVPGLEVVGEVADAKEFLLQGTVMVVPLFSGSGIRIKIIEALAHGKAVITTSIGAEGIACVNGRDILLADNAESMTEAIILALTDTQLCTSLGKNAIELIRKQHTREELIGELISFYEQL